jgi:hypothetical protein
MALNIALAERGDVVAARRYLVAYRRHGAAMSNAIARMRRSEALVREDVFLRRPDLPALWRRLAEARHLQRAIWRPLRHGAPGVAWDALRAARAEGWGTLALALGWWAPVGLVEDLTTLPAAWRGWLGRDVGELWSITLAAPHDSRAMAGPPLEAR